MPLHGPDAQVRGHGDVAIPNEDGSWRKVLGASLRQRRGYVYYLGVLMIDQAVPTWSATSLRPVDSLTIGLIVRMVIFVITWVATA